ncbi:unnamed protein product [Ixodes hexagonus]
MGTYRRPEELKTMEPTTIRDLKPGMKNLSIIFIVLEIGEQLKRRLLVAFQNVEPRSRLSNPLAIRLFDKGWYCCSANIACAILHLYASLWKGCLTLYTGKGGEIQKIGEFCLPFSETPFMSEPNPEFQLQLQAKLSANMDQRRSPTSQVGGADPMGIPAPLPGNGHPGGVGFGPRIRQGMPYAGMRMPVPNHNNGFGGNAGPPNPKVRPHRR